MWLLICSELSPLFPLIYGRKARFSILWWYAFAGITTDLLTSLFKRVLHWQYLWPANIFALIEFTLIACYYRRKIFHSDIAFRSLLISGWIFFSVYVSLEKGWDRMNGVAISLFLLCYIALGILGFYALIKEQKNIFIEESSFFWANVAIFIYASGSFFIFLAEHSLEKNDLRSLQLIWGTAFLSLNILKNILLGIALAKKHLN